MQKTTTPLPLWYRGMADNIVLLRAQRHRDDIHYSAAMLAGYLSGLYMCSVIDNPQFDLLHELLENAAERTELSGVAAYGGNMLEESNSGNVRLNDRLGGSEELLRQAMERWGTVAQMRMAVEEFSELTQELMHFLRNRTTQEKVAGEVADVLIMAHQMRIVFGKETVDRIVNEKLERLQTRLDAAEHALRDSDPAAIRAFAASPQASRVQTLVENIRDHLDRLTTETEYLQQHQQVTLAPVFDIATLISIEIDHIDRLVRAA